MTTAAMMLMLPWTMFKSASMGTKLSCMLIFG
jgi:hypothetical protein